MTTDLADLLDACPDCAHRNLTFPATVTRTWRGARCVYVCSAGHEWTCAWAGPGRRSTTAPIEGEDAS